MRVAVAGGTGAPLTKAQETTLAPIDPLSCATVFGRGAPVPPYQPTSRHPGRLEPGRKRGDTTMAVAGICELVLETEDVEGLASFYRDLGLRLLAEEEDRVWLSVGGRCRLGIWSPGEKEYSDRG